MIRIKLSPPAPAKCIRNAVLLLSLSSKFPEETGVHDRSREHASQASKYLRSRDRIEVSSAFSLWTGTYDLDVLKGSLGGRRCPRLLSGRHHGVEYDVRS
jgi:hypothetical protein